MNFDEAYKVVHAALVHLKNQPYCQAEGAQALDALAALVANTEPVVVVSGEEIDSAFADDSV